MYFSFLFAPTWFPHKAPCENGAGGEVGVDYVDVIDHESPNFVLLVKETRWGGITPHHHHQKEHSLVVPKPMLHLHISLLLIPAPIRTWAIYILLVTIMGQQLQVIMHINKIFNLFIFTFCLHYGWTCAF